MAFQQGLSGLNVYSKALDVVSNNIANASTVGFKCAQAHFADVYAGALNGAAATQIGIGVNLVAVQQQFNQGNITVTSNSLDMAINGNGFFRFQKSPLDQTPYYSRNGQFHLDQNGYIVNSNGCFLTGFDSPDGVSVNTASIVPLTVGTAAIPPKQTGWTTAVDAAKGGLAIGVNLDSRSTKAVSVTDPAWTALTPFAWDNTFNVNMFNYSTSATIYDQAGAAHTLTNYYVRQGDSGVAARTWDVYTVIDNKYCVEDGAGNPQANTLVFNTNGTLASVNGSGTTRVPLDLSQTILNTGAAANLMDNSPAAAPPNMSWFEDLASIGGAFFLDMGSTTQFGMPNNVDHIRQDGYIAGTMTNLTVSEEGYVVASYSNGQTKMMGQVLLTEFANPHGLQSAGDNLWIETFSSGQPTIGEPGGGTRGIIQSGAVEDSNTDLTQELVNMIIMQRNYQANAQTIRTQDQILQTLVNLR
ncbi:MAG: flagellar hook protein FlgE [Zoogloeaceae bacterium]|jgi:flagellar hook protein FlgE|nr:flagellar hook protein FlgE [Zoogloeaceae bacterium]